MRKINRAGMALIKEFEQGPEGGPALKSYLCPGQKWTISYGITGPDIGPGMVITLGQAELLLIDRMMVYERGVAEALRIDTSDNQFAAMVCLAFNIGLGWKGKTKPKGAKNGFLQSDVLLHHNAGNPALAAQAFMEWTKATGADGVKRQLKGLTRRRAAEMQLYLTPTTREIEQDPPRTRASDVEASSVGADPVPGLTKIAAVGATVAGAATATGQVVAQVEPVWTGLQQAAGPATPHILLALIGLVAVLAICGTVYLIARRKGRAV